MWDHLKRIDWTPQYLQRNVESCSQNDTCEEDCLWRIFDCLNDVFDTISIVLEVLWRQLNNELIIWWDCILVRICDQKPTIFLNNIVKYRFTFQKVVNSNKHYRKFIARISTIRYLFWLIKYDLNLDLEFVWKLYWPIWDSLLGNVCKWLYIFVDKLQLDAARLDNLPF